MKWAYKLRGNLNDGNSQKHYLPFGLWSISSETLFTYHRMYVVQVAHNMHWSCYNLVYKLKIIVVQATYIVLKKFGYYSVFDVM